VVVPSKCLLYPRPLEPIQDRLRRLQPGRFTPPLKCSTKFSGILLRRILEKKRLGHFEEVHSHMGHADETRNPYVARQTLASSQYMSESRRCHSAQVLKKFLRDGSGSVTSEEDRSDGPELAVWREHEREQPGGGSIGAFLDQEGKQFLQ